VQKLIKMTLIHFVINSLETGLHHRGDMTLKIVGTFPIYVDLEKVLGGLIKEKEHLTLTVKVIVSPTSCGSSHSKCTRQLLGQRYFPVTYWRSECLASGARAGCVIAARVTSPATDTETTSMPPVSINLNSEHSNICCKWLNFLPLSK
jgi:hypothetical protein